MHDELNFAKRQVFKVVVPPQKLLLSFSQVEVALMDSVQSGVEGCNCLLSVRAAVHIRGRQVVVRVDSCNELSSGFV